MGSQQALVVILLCMGLSLVHSYKFLFLTMQVSGHLSEVAGLADGLIKRGHTVYVVTDENFPYPGRLKSVTGIKYLHYKSPDINLANMGNTDREMSDGLFAGRFWPLIAKEILKPRVDYACYQPLIDEDLFKKLKDIKFDMAILDILPCYYAIPYRLGIPVSGLSTGVIAYNQMIQPLLSLLPCEILGERNTFFQRLKIFAFINGIYLLANAISDDKIYLDYLRKVHGKAPSSLIELTKNYTVHIANTNHIMDCARPANPDMVYVGGLAATDPKPLTKDLEDFINQGQHGFIVMSMGSVIATYPQETIDKFLGVFQKLKQQVFWRVRIQPGQKVNPPKNVKVMEWLPQNSLLGHPSAKLLITHCGNSGQSEAVYNGVPIIGMPLFGEQTFNAQRFEAKGFGLTMNMFDFTADELYNNIQEVINNPKYTAAIKKASKLMKLEDPKNKAVDLLEHALKYGVDHLKTPATNMSAIQFLMIDIFLFLLGVIIIIGFINYKIFKWLFRKCCRKGSSENKKQKQN